MVTLVWGGGEGVLGEGSPPPLVFNYSKEALGRGQGGGGGAARYARGGWGHPQRQKTNRALDERLGSAAQKTAATGTRARGARGQCRESNGGRSAVTEEAPYGRWSLRWAAQRRRKAVGVRRCAWGVVHNFMQRPPNARATAKS